MEKENLGILNSTRTCDHLEVSIAIINISLDLVGVHLAIHYHNVELIGTSLSTSIGQSIKIDMSLSRVNTASNSNDSMV